MSKFKKIITLTLCLASVSMLFGCGKSGSDNDNSAADGTIGEPVSYSETESETVNFVDIDAAIGETQTDANNSFQCSIGDVYDYGEKSPDGKVYTFLATITNNTSKDISASYLNSFFYSLTGDDYKTFDISNVSIAGKHGISSFFADGIPAGKTVSSPIFVTIPEDNDGDFYFEVCLLNEDTKEESDFKYHVTKDNIKTESEDDMVKSYKDYPLSLQR